MDGIIVVDKPEDYTSFDVIAKLRGMMHFRKMGHSGTLDPMATGVLPVFIGKATKAIDIIPDDTKRYLARVRLGIKTDTGDYTGTLIEQSDLRPDLEALRDSAIRKKGISMQVPPMYSAIKVDGQRLYSLARQGKTVERKPRQIEIFNIDVNSFNGNEFSLEVVCRKGLYVRTLAEDIAGECGCLATLTGLRRIQSGPFSESESFTLEEIQTSLDNGTLETLIKPVDSVFLDYSEVFLDDIKTRKYLNGVHFPTDIQDSVIVRVYNENRFLGLAYSKDGLLYKKVQFNDISE